MCYTHVFLRDLSLSISMYIRFVDLVFCWNDFNWSKITYSNTNIVLNSKISWFFTCSRKASAWSRNPTLMKNWTTSSTVHLDASGYSPLSILGTDGWFVSLQLPLAFVVSFVKNLKYFWILIWAILAILEITWTWLSFKQWENVWKRSSHKLKRAI